MSGLPKRILAAQQTHVPPAATSATDSADGYLVLGFTDEQDRVRHYTRDNAGWHPLTEAESLVDESSTLFRETDGESIALGGSYRRVAVGYAPPSPAHPGRVMVAWTFEDEHQFRAKVRWAIRDRNDPSEAAWCYDMVETRFRTSPGIGYDEVNDRFVLTYLENSNGPGLPTVRTIDPLTCQASAKKVIEPQGLTEPEGLHDIGKPVCRRVEPQFGPDHTSCVIPIATTGENGPCLGWYAGALPNGSIGTLDDEAWDRKIHCLRNFGQGDLARDPLGAAGMVGTLTHFARGADPVADTSPLCALPGCGFQEAPETQIFLLYRLADPSDGDAIGGFVNAYGANAAKGTALFCKSSGRRASRPHDSRSSG